MKNSLQLKTHSIDFVLLYLVFLLPCCGKSSTDKDKYPELKQVCYFSVLDEIEINDSCIYIMHPAGEVGNNTIIEINPNKKSMNTTLREFDSYTLNGNKLIFRRDYTFHLENIDVAFVGALDALDTVLLSKYLSADNNSFFNYIFYNPKKHKLHWLNTQDGVNENELLALSWIKTHITKINIVENVYYQMLSENKKSFTELSKESLNSWYIIPQRELPYLPPWFDNLKN